MMIEVTDFSILLICKFKQYKHVDKRECTNLMSDLLLLGYSIKLLATTLSPNGVHFQNCGLLS